MSCRSIQTVNEASVGNAI